VQNRVGMKEVIGGLVTRGFIDSPVFVVGANRSGTSVLLRALGAHPDILGSIGEAPLMVNVAAIADLVEFSEFRDYYAENMRLPKDYLYSHLRRLCFEYAIGRDFGWDRIAPSLKHLDRSILQKRYWCAKIFPVKEESRGLRQLFQGARFVYIVRNGIEVVHSRTKFPGFRDLDFETQCREWVSQTRAFDHLTTAEDVIQIRHENLVADAEDLLQKVFSFLGLEQDSAPVNLVRSTLVIPLDQPDSAGVDAKQVLRARRPPHETWTPEQRATFKAIAGEAMTCAGYKMPF
jgi:hypothetical protein